MIAIGAEILGTSRVVLVMLLMTMVMLMVAMVVMMTMQFVANKRQEPLEDPELRDTIATEGGFTMASSGGVEPPRLGRDLGFSMVAGEELRRSSAREVTASGA